MFDADLDPARLARREFLYQAPTILLVLITAWPTVKPAAVAAWAATVLLLVLVEQALSGRRRRVAPAVVTFLLSLAYAVAAMVLIQKGGAGERLFSVVLLTSSMIGVLLRYFHRKRLFTALVAPQALVLGLVGYSMFRQSMAEGGGLAMLIPAATIALFAMMFYAARAQLAQGHDAVRRITAQALARERQAKAADKAKSDFLAAMSHELRTPLNGVLGMTQALEAEPLAGAHRDRVRTIHRCADSLLGLVDDVLEFSNIEAGRVELAQVEFDLEATVRGTAETFAAAAADKGLAFETVISEAAAGAYRGDPARLRQLLHKLLSNAVKFTDQGGVRLEIGRADDKLVIEVADTGVGLDAETAASLFGKFVQADSSRTRRFGGAGLGLTICQEVVRAMKGEIEVESAPGAGARFRLTLPLERVADAAPAARGERSLRVLAAEDNLVNQQVLSILLGQVGIAPVIAPNGREAVEAWGDGEWDVILMDIQMPEMDGVAATRAIRLREQAEGRTRTPIIAVTANAMPEQAAEYEAAGMDALIPKPLEVGRLFETLDQVLSRAAA